jgi:hypothetical protein
MKTAIDRRSERCRLRIEVGRLGPVHGFDQGMRLVVARENEVDDGGAGDAVLGDEKKLIAGWLAEHDDGLTDRRL